MEKLLRIINACRTKWLTTIEDLSTEQMNFIPPGFKNNLAWQLGHVVVSQQILCYRLSGNKFVIEEELIDLYKNGSKPERDFSSAEIAQMKGYLLSTIAQLENDLDHNLFANFTPYSISTYAGVELKNIEDALTFIISHDGLHYGCSIGLKKLV
ncbi:DinB family protein [Pedobacter namyangjuensis]|uniref:DinB family protein n=1 Tax=Pedobacter namyangjuensis TaxID=600626 RepID=UPI000DE45703|nr:DinB family protein [Pedobacter namyangjuensis]